MTVYRFAQVAFLACATLLFGALPSAARAEAKRPRHEYGSCVEMLGAAPAELKPQPGGKWTDAQIEAVNAKLKEQVVGQPASIAMKVRGVEKAEGGTRRIYAERSKPPIAMGAVLTQHAYFTAEKVAQLARVKTGQVVRVTGTISKCRITRDKNELFYEVEIVDCELPNK